nr:MAG TPA: hypothetical protein [Bacteriophage sp.]
MLYNKFPILSNNPLNYEIFKLNLNLAFFFTNSHLRIDSLISFDCGFYCFDKACFPSSIFTKYGYKTAEITDFKFFYSLEVFYSNIFNFLAHFFVILANKSWFYQSEFLL